MTKLITTQNEFTVKNVKNLSNASPIYLITPCYGDFNSNTCADKLPRIKYLKIVYLLNEGFKLSKRNIISNNSQLCEGRFKYYSLLGNLVIIAEFL